MQTYLGNMFAGMGVRQRRNKLQQHERDDNKRTE